LLEFLHAFSGEGGTTRVLQVSRSSGMLIK